MISRTNSDPVAAANQKHPFIEISKVKTRGIFVFLFLLLITPCILVFSQTEGSGNNNRNRIYAELYIVRHDFSDGFISFNYERNFGRRNNNFLRIGIYPDFESTVSFPVTLTRITHPSGDHHFEYGAGIAFRVESFEGNIYKDVPAIIFPLMYRYQKSQGFIFRGGLNVFVSWPTIPSPSISMGYQF